MVERVIPPTEVPPEARAARRSLEKWLDEGRRSRGVPEAGLPPAVMFHQCDETCTRHDRLK